jgi:hypothetical protein
MLLGIYKVVSFPSLSGTLRSILVYTLAPTHRIFIPD